jgi:hypothetical protein
VHSQNPGPAKPHHESGGVITVTVIGVGEGIGSSLCDRATKAMVKVRGQGPVNHIRVQ